MKFVTERGKEYHGREWYHTNTNIGKKSVVLRDSNTVIEPILDMIQDKYHLVPGHYPCDLYITWQDVIFSSADICRARNSLVVEHGCFAIMDYLPPLNPNRVDLPKRLICNRIAVYGSGDYELMTTVGNTSPDRVILTGMPAADYLVGRNIQEDKDFLFSKIGIPTPKGPIIGYLPSHDCTRAPYGHLEFLPILQQITRQHPDWTIIIKHYANDSHALLDSTNGWIELENIVCLNGAGWDQSEAINCMDVVLVLHHGTAVMKALALGKPVISVYRNEDTETGTWEVWGKAPYFNYVDIALQDNAIQLIHKPNVEQLDSVIQENLSNQTVRKSSGISHAEKWLGPLDGKSRERLVNLIDQMVG